MTLEDYPRQVLEMAIAVSAMMPVTLRVGFHPTRVYYRIRLAVCATLTSRANVAHERSQITGYHLN
jgi:hypothetical protein